MQEQRFNPVRAEVEALQPNSRSPPRSDRQRQIRLYCVAMPRGSEVRVRPPLPRLQRTRGGKCVAFFHFKAMFQAGLPS